MSNKMTLRLAMKDVLIQMVAVSESLRGQHEHVGAILQDPDTA